MDRTHSQVSDRLAPWCPGPVVSSAGPCVKLGRIFMATATHRSEGRTRPSPSLSPPLPHPPQERVVEGKRPSHTCLLAWDARLSRLSLRDRTKCQVPARRRRDISTQVMFQQRRQSMVRPTKDIANVLVSLGSRWPKTAPEWAGEPLVLGSSSTGRLDSTMRVSGIPASKSVSLWWGVLPRSRLRV